MAEDPITRLNAALEGRYRIERELGEGGMATVYLADDLRHERKVALKVLKPELAAVVGAERFLAEIKTTANLQHPHILPLFDSGEASGFLFYVMPYVKGESLRDRLDREHQLAVDDAVQITSDVAGALDYAHRQGVIHRDIKPANILLQDGEPVISDFGIALAVSAGGGGRLTETGLSLGTPHYMSPEQATGDLNVGAATDIYALGCVLYEMLVGEPPYTGGNAQAVLGKIIAGELAAATQHRASVPTNVDAAIQRALEKVPADRFTGAQDFAGALADPGFRHGELAVAGVVASEGPWKRVSSGLGVLSLLLALGLGWSLLRPAPPAAVARFPSPFVEGEAPLGSAELTPDGSALVYVGPASSGVGRQLWVRRWDNLSATPMPGTEGAEQLRLSPDGGEVAFIEDSSESLRIVPLAGGTGRTLVEPVSEVGAWSEDGWIYFRALGGWAIERVPATGGAAEIVTERAGDGIVHTLPHVLPGGRAMVFQALDIPQRRAEIWSLDIESGEQTMLTAGTSPHYVPTGHLLFGVGDSRLMAAPFDVARAELTGAAVPVAEGLLLGNAFGVMVMYSVSQSGTLIYATGEAGDLGQRSVVWVDRDGREESIDAPQNPYQYPRLSRDGDRLALDARGEEDGIWIWNFVPETLTRLILGDGAYRYPVWTPDGERVAYTTSGSLYWKASNNTGVPELLAEAPGNSPDPYFFTPDQTGLVFRDEQNPATDDDLVMISIGADSGVVWRLNGNYRERNAELSADGAWMAYQSDESGEFEIYVRPFPLVDEDQIQVSNNGGVRPVWSRAGGELFYIQRAAAAELISVSFDTDETGRFVFRDREVVMEWPYFIGQEGRNYDVSPDGQRFVAVKSAVAGGSAPGLPVVLIQNFFEELKRLAPN